MESGFRPEAWRDLYVMLGTSAAALIGLLFVVTSLRVNEFLDNEAFHIRARNITLHLLAMMVQSAAVLTPQPETVLGAELMAINLCGISLPISFLYRAYFKNRQLGKRGGFSIYRALTFISGYSLGFAGGVGLLRHLDWGIYLVTISIVSFFVSVIWDAWKIMFGVGPTENSKKQT